MTPTLARARSMLAARAVLDRQPRRAATAGARSAADGGSGPERGGREHVGHAHTENPGAARHTHTPSPTPSNIEPRTTTAAIGAETMSISVSHDYPGFFEQIRELQTRRLLSDAEGKELCKS